MLCEVDLTAFVCILMSLKPYRQIYRLIDSILVFEDGGWLCIWHLPVVVRTERLRWKEEQVSAPIMVDVRRRKLAVVSRHFSSCSCSL